MTAISSCTQGPHTSCLEKIQTRLSGFQYRHRHVVTMTCLQTVMSMLSLVTSFVILNRI